MGHVLSVKGSWMLLQRQGSLCVAVVAILLISPLTIEAQDSTTYFLPNQRKYNVPASSLGHEAWELAHGEMLSVM